MKYPPPTAARVVEGVRSVRTTSRFSSFVRHSVFAKADLKMRSPAVCAARLLPTPNTLLKA